MTFLRIAEASTESIITGDWVQDSSISMPDVTVGTKDIADPDVTAPAENEPSDALENTINLSKLLSSAKSSAISSAISKSMSSTKSAVVTSLKSSTRSLGVSSTTALVTSAKTSRIIQSTTAGAVIVPPPTLAPGGNQCDKVLCEQIFNFKIIATGTKTKLSSRT